MRFECAQLADALELLRSTAGLTRAKPGCRCCRVARDVADETVLHYSEEWDTDAAFRLHVRSNDFWPVLVTLDLCAEEPQVVIGELHATCGMDALRAIRESSGNDGGTKSEPRT